MPRGELSLDEYVGAPDSLEALPDGLDFGNEFEEDDDATGEPDVADIPDTDSDTADASDDGGDAAGDKLDDAADGDEDEDEGATDDTSDADDQEPAPAAKEKGKQEPKIPKSRLDQSIRKQRQAEQRAQELEAELARMRSIADEASRPKLLTAEEIKSKMAEANEALIGGDTEKAAALQAELFSVLAPQPSAPAEPAPPVDLAAEVEARLEFRAVVKDVYARFPELDENHEQFDEELALESVELQQSYVRRGYTMAEATQKAAEAVAKLNDLEDRRAEKTPPSTPSKDKLLQAAKTKEKIVKAAKAPPPMSGKTKGEGNDAININELSEDEFMALPDSVRNKLLGMTL